MSALIVLTALKEEEYLLSGFKEEYMKWVPWRFIPKVF